MSFRRCFAKRKCHRNKLNLFQTSPGKYSSPQKTLNRLRLFLHFPSRKVEQAKRERAIFTLVLVLLALLSLRENEGLLVG